MKLSELKELTEKATPGSMTHAMQEQLRRLVYEESVFSRMLPSRKPITRLQRARGRIRFLRERLALWLAPWLGEA